MAIKGNEIIAPYFIKSKKVNLTLLSFTNPENIMPASAPIGAKNAPMLLPMIDAYVAVICALPDKVVIKLENKILIGILLITLLMLTSLSIIIQLFKERNQVI